MKKDTHPKYQQVLFVDSASGYKFVVGSTLQPEGKEKFEGKEYPVYYLSISSTSHPFFTGSKQLVDSEGRVEKFKKRFERKAQPDQEQPQKEKEEASADQKKEKKAPAKAASKTTGKTAKKQ